MESGPRQTEEDFCKERMDRMELCVQQKDRRGDTQKGEKCGAANFAGAVAEITVNPMRAEASDYHSKPRDSLTAQSITALSYSGISFSTIV